MGTQSDLLLGLAKSARRVEFEAVYRTELPCGYNFFRSRLGARLPAEDLIRIAESVP